MKLADDELGPGGVLIAGGGTAGHLVPGLAVAEALSQSGWAVSFACSQRALDAELIGSAGYAFAALPGKGLSRRRLGLGNLGAAWALLRGLIGGIGLVGRTRPVAVLSLGGYAAVPAAVGAIMWRVPVVLLEQNARASAANRLLKRFAKAAAVPVLGTGLRKEVLTGNPVRSSVAELAQADTNKAELRARLGWPTEEAAVVVFGGSLGSVRINQAVWQAVAGSAASPGELPFIYHIVGRRDWDARPLTDLGDRYKSVAYDNDLPLALAAADLVVARAGASTVAELSVLAKPCVLIPLPNAPNDHQRLNAEACAAAGLAALVKDEELDAARLVLEIRSGLERAAHRAAPSDGPSPDSSSVVSQPAFARPDSASQVAGLVAEHARQVPRG